MHPPSCTNTHHEVADLVNHGTVKNTKHNVYTKQKNS